MSLKIDKTEREFRERMGRWGMGIGMQEGLIQALDLEFREEEGEGLPEEIGYTDLSPSRMLLLDEEGKPLGVVTVERRKMPVEDLCALLVRSFGRYNDYPKLEALARELRKALSEGWAPRTLRSTKALERARELLGREG